MQKCRHFCEICIPSLSRTHFFCQTQNWIGRPWCLSSLTPLGNPTHRALFSSPIFLSFISLFCFLPIRHLSEAHFFWSLGPWLNLSHQECKILWGVEECSRCRPLNQAIGLFLSLSVSVCLCLSVSISLPQKHTTHTHLPVKGAVALEKNRKKYWWWKSWIFSVRAKHPSTSQNVEAQAKMSKCKPKRKSASQNVKARAETSKHKPNVHVQAKTSKYKPTHQGARQNV